MKYSDHSTYYNKDKVEVPSVTTILKILNKPFLTKWANFMGFKRKNVDDILERSSEIGTLVHKMIECYLLNKMFIFIPSRHVAKTLAMMYLNSFLEWKSNHTVEPIFMERKFSVDKFGGTVDFYGMVDGKHTILDFKTSKQVYSSMFLQLSFYCIMLEEHGFIVDQAAIIIVNDGKYNEKFITREELEEYIPIARLLVDLFHVWYDINLEKGWGNILK